MFTVFEDRRMTDNGKWLVCNYESTLDARCMCKEFTNHATSSTAAQLSGDALHKYITSCDIPVTGAEHCMQLFYTGKNRSPNTRNLS
jgi:hypothetical protein